MAFRTQARIPAGLVKHFAGAAAPAGWLACDGSTVSRTTYAALFLAIGTTYGVGDGATTFAIPDLRGEFVRGLDSGRGVDTGRALGSAQAHEVVSHGHGFTGGTAAITYPGAATGGLGGGGLYGPTGAGAIANTGGAETRPRNVAMLPCIKY